MMPWETVTDTITGDPASPVDMLRRVQQELRALSHRMVFQGRVDNDEQQHLAELDTMIEHVLTRDRTVR